MQHRTTDRVPWEQRDYSGKVFLLLALGAFILGAIQIGTYGVQVLDRLIIALQ